MLIYEERPKDDIDIRIRKDTDFPPHFHRCLEMIYIFDGGQKFFVERKEYEIGAGDMLIIFPYQIHEFIKSENKSALIIADTEQLGDYNIEFKEYIPESPVIKSSALPANYGEQISLLLSYKHSASAYSRPIIKGVINVIIGEALSVLTLVKSGQGAFGGNYGALMRRAVSYCMNNFLSPDISLKKMAADLNISPSYLSHFLSDKLHIGFCSYINSLRIDHACALLCRSDRSVTDIAYTCGYNSIRTFNRVFLSLKGVAPLKYKEMNK